MGAKINVGGIEITVPVGELGDALRQLAPWMGGAVAASPPPQRAPTTSWPLPTGPSVDSPLGGKPSLADVPDRTGSLLSGVATQKPLFANEDAQSRALALFRALSEHKGPGGMTPEAVMKLLGTTHPKGIGNRMQAVNAILRTIGIAAEDVYSNARNEMGTRMWVPRSRISEAIEAIERLASTN